MKQRPALVFDPFEVLITIGSIPTTALLNTGSTVSTMTVSVYEKHLSDHPI